MTTTRTALSTILVLGLVACGGGTPEPAAPEAAPAAPSTPPAAHEEHGHGHGHGHGATEAAGPLVAPGEAKVGDKTTCPVSGEEFVVEATSPKVEHDGKTYYFCCAGCRKKFESDPAKFTAPKS